MTIIESLFVTRLYRTEIGGAAGRRIVADLEHESLAIARDDLAGQAWCRANGYSGYTSYASLSDLTSRSPTFAALAVHLDSHVAAFARSLDLDLGRRKLRLDSIWINVLDPGGFHAGHIHPHSVVSGTFYVCVPAGTSGLKLEDPRLPMLMAARPRKATAKRDNATFVTVEPKAGTLLLWESWLRHEVPPNATAERRVSISFNYAWS